MSRECEDHKETNLKLRKDMQAFRDRLDDNIGKTAKLYDEMLEKKQEVYELSG